MEGILIKEILLREAWIEGDTLKTVELGRYKAGISLDTIDFIHLNPYYRNIGRPESIHLSILNELVIDFPKNSNIKVENKNGFTLNLIPHSTQENITKLETENLQEVII